MSDELRLWYDFGDLNLYGRDMRGLATITEKELVLAYNRHDERVRSYFKGRPSDLMIIDVTDKSAMPLTHLVAFLERLGIIGIPNTNSRDEVYSLAWKRS